MGKLKGTHCILFMWWTWTQTDYMHRPCLKEVAGHLKDVMKWSFTQIVVRVGAVIQENTYVCIQAREWVASREGYQSASMLQGSAQVGAAGLFNCTSGQVCKKSVLSLTRITSVCCAVLTGIEQGHHLWNGTRSHFPCSSQHSSPPQMAMSLPPIPGTAITPAKWVAQQELPQSKTELTFRKH